MSNISTFISKTLSTSIHAHTHTHTPSLLSFILIFFHFKLTPWTKLKRLDHLDNNDEVNGCFWWLMMNDNNDDYYNDYYDWMDHLEVILERIMNQWVTSSYSYFSHFIFFTLFFFYLLTYLLHIHQFLIFLYNIFFPISNNVFLSICVRLLVMHEVSCLTIFVYGSIKQCWRSFILILTFLSLPRSLCLSGSFFLTLFNSYWLV